MKAILIAMLCLSVAACSTTAGGPDNVAAATDKKPTAQASQKKNPARKKDACEEAMQAQTNAAMLGGALGMVGSFGGFAGRGGMVASQVASTAGSMVATSQSAKAQGMMQECY